MQKNRKRKLKSAETETKSAKINNGNKEEPYPTHPRPTPEECLCIRDSLLAFHGFPQEFAKYRKQRLGGDDDNKSSDVNSDTAEETVLDGLVKTVLSQNTTEVNSQRAFDNLKSDFPTWQDVLAAEPKWIENAIRCGGLAPAKASCIKNILNCLLEKKGKICLEYLRDMSVDEIKAELSQFKGVGPKTVACVLMFHLQQEDFPVDTHVSARFIMYCQNSHGTKNSGFQSCSLENKHMQVFEIAKALGWVPEVADRNKTYLHLNQRIPNELKFDLNCLLYTHGKLCRKCIKKRGNQSRKESHDDSCPLLSYCNSSSVKTTDEIN
ncbi:putative DNA glycosylase At3g47830 isoform X1 [Ricinus communis]|uniref:putative DNA glycosylase At3g47830 isoform X1 n=1 Tax=Ricinus communis TaxID=3988 RepID=UPI00201ADE06|nr:putative DNA glycosylase At3g47830 isoform X1 [Ricinus communis]